MTTQVIQRQVTATIQAIALKQGAKGEYGVVTTQPRPGMKFPDNYNAWDTEVVKGYKAGDSVVLTLQRGRAKEDNPHEEKDWYWDLVALTRAAPALAGTTPPAKPQATALGDAPPRPLAISVSDPWHRYVSWGDLVEQAATMVQDTLPVGTPAQPAPALTWHEYVLRFKRALALICAAIREEMGRSLVEEDPLFDDAPEPATGGPVEPQDRPSGPKADAQAHSEAQRPALEKAQGDARASRATYASLEALWAKGSGLTNYAEIEADLKRGWKARQERLRLTGLMTEAQCLAWIADIEKEQGGK